MHPPGRRVISADLGRWGRRSLWSPKLAELAFRALPACRTPALGGQLYRCQRCGRDHFVPHSCGNRHCPLCQGQAAVKWVAAQESLLLPVPYGWCPTQDDDAEAGGICPSLSPARAPAAFRQDPPLRTAGQPRAPNPHRRDPGGVGNPRLRARRNCAGDRSRRARAFALSVLSGRHPDLGPDRTEAQTQWLGSAKSTLRLLLTTGR